ncbi:MAG: hypothetical protein ACI865_002451 [Flavobacteriaceae bacterium]|jgi:hypothetical protein
MANLPVVDKNDARKGLIASLLLMLIGFVLLSFMYYEIPDPLPAPTIVVTHTEIDEIVLKELKMEGGIGGGDPTDAPIDEPKPQTQEVITNTKPSNTQVPTGSSTHTNANNPDNTASTTVQDPNPFATGGDGGGEGGGSGDGFGTDSGNTNGGGSGTGTGAAGRKRLNNVSVNGIYINTHATIGFKLTVDAQGNVIAFTNVKGTTTTTDQNLINKIGYAIKKQVKFNKDPGSPLVYQFYTVRVKAT